jgi:pentatricopeptide repeat domain-containing protein 1
MQAKGLEASEDLFLIKILPALSKAGRWRESRDTLARMKRQGVGVPVEAHRLALLACRRSGQWQKALESLQELRRVGPAPSLACYEIVLESCAQGRRWVEGEGLFKEMQRVDRVQPSLMCYRAMLELCGKVGRWGEALRLWKEVERRMQAKEEGEEEEGEEGGEETQRERLVGCFQGALMACQQASRWAEAFALLQQQETEHKNKKCKKRLLASMTPETRTQCYALVLGACSKVGEWGPALDLLQRIPRPDEACFEAVLEACARAGKWKEALTTLRELERRVERGEGLVLEAGNHQLAMWACLQAGRAQEAVDLMEEMTERKGLVPTARAYVTYFKALQRLGRWEESVRGLEEARRNNVLLLGRGGEGGKSGGGSGNGSQELLALATVSQTCGRAGRWREVLGLLMCELGREEGGREGGPCEWEAMPYNGVPLTVVEVLLGERRVQEAVLFVEGLAKEVGMDPGLPLVNRLLEGLAKAGEWAICQELLLGEDEVQEGSSSNSSSSRRRRGNSMKARFHTTPDVASFSVVMSAAAAGVAAGTGHASSAAQELTQLLPMMRTRHGVKPDLVAYNVTANLHRRSGDWMQVLALLEEMKEEAAAAAAGDSSAGEVGGVAPDVVTYSTAMAACGEAGEWEKALELLAEMSLMGVPPNVVAYTAAVAACGRGGQPGRALGLLREMKSEGVNPNLQCYNTLLWAVAKSGDWQQCLALLEEMKEAGKTDAHSFRIVMRALKNEQGQEDVVEALRAEMVGLRAETANDSFESR